MLPALRLFLFAILFFCFSSTTFGELLPVAATTLTTSSESSAVPTVDKVETKGSIKGQTAMEGLKEGLFSLANRKNIPSGMRLILLFTVLSLAPAVLVMVTSFTRIIIVLHFIRKALGLSEIPPTSVLTGLAVFLTFFNMASIFDEVYKDAVVPVTKGKLAWEEGLKRGTLPLQRFMLAQTRQSDLKLFARLSRLRRPRSVKEVPLVILVPAFVLSELKTAFQIGIILFLPFLLVDLVVASTLLSSGLSGLSPASVSLPFKLLLFVLIDGWGLILSSLMRSFR